MHSFTFLPSLTGARPQLVKLGFSLAAGMILSHCSSSSSTKSEVVVSVADQRMGVYEEGVLKKQYVISTSKFGLGDQPNSYRTPTGKHEIIAKIGQGLPPGAVLKSRSWNGEVLKPNAPGRDPIVSRIMWLRGLESSNSNAMRRYIYIHGTTEESRLGQPASYGCIRMGMKDVVEVFDEIGIGAKVVITKEHLPGGKKPEKVKDAPVPAAPAPEAQPQPLTPPTEDPVLLAAAASAPKKEKQSPEKEAALAAAAAEPAAAGPIPVTEDQLKPSAFSFLPWSRSGKAKVEATSPPPPPAPVKVEPRPAVSQQPPVETAPPVAATPETAPQGKKLFSFGKMFASSKKAEAAPEPEAPKARPSEKKPEAEKPAPARKLVAAKKQPQEEKVPETKKEAPSKLVKGNNPRSQTERITSVNGTLYLNPSAQL